MNGPFFFPNTLCSSINLKSFQIVIHLTMCLVKWWNFRSQGRGDPNAIPPLLANSIFLSSNSLASLSLSFSFVCLSLSIALSSVNPSCSPFTYALILSPSYPRALPASIIPVVSAIVNKVNTKEKIYKSHQLAPVLLATK